MPDLGERYAKACDPAFAMLTRTYFDLVYRGRLVFGDGAKVANGTNSNIAPEGSEVVNKDYYVEPRFLKNTSSDNEFTMFLTRGENQNIGDQIDVLYHFLLWKLCHSIDSYRYELDKTMSSYVCRVTAQSGLSQKISLNFELPTFFEYLFDWLVNFRSYVLDELFDNYVGVIVGTLASICVGYLILVLFVYFSQYLVWIAVDAIPTVLFAGGIVIIGLVAASFSNSGIITHNIFGYSNPTSTLLQVVTYVLGIALIIAAGVVSLLIYSKKQSIQLAISAVKLSSSVIKKRMRILVMPIIYIALQILNMFVCIYFVIGLIMTGAYDI